MQEPDQTAREWSDPMLSSMRHVCDPVADGLIHNFFSSEAPTGTNPHDLLQDIMNYRVHGRETRRLRATNSRFKVEKISVPESLVNRLLELDPPPTPDPDLLQRASRFFVDYGPEVMSMFGYYALPIAYGASNGVHVLAATEYLEKRAMRRVIETSQFAIDVLKPGGLSSEAPPNELVPGTPPGQGIQSAAEVRLMHAAIRYLIHSSNHTWDPAWGHPINQEDLAGTLMTFSTIVLRGFEKLNVRLSSQAQDDYIQVWSIVGKIMGIHDDLLPNSYAEGSRLFEAIASRQLRGSDLGRALMTALLDAYEKQIPVPFSRAFNASFIRFYLDSDLADALGVPRQLPFDLSSKFFGKAYGVIDSLTHTLPFGREAYRWYARQILIALIATGRGHEVRAPFDLPLELSGMWKIPSPHQVVKGP